MREVQFHGDDPVCVCAAGCLVEAGYTIRADIGGPELQTMSALRQHPGSVLVVQPLDNGIWARNDARRVEGGEVAVRVDLEREHGVVFEVVADWQIDPFAGGRQCDPRTTALDCTQLFRRPDARVEEDARRGQRSSGEDDFSAGTGVDDLSAPVGLLDLHAGNATTAPDQSTDLGVQPEGEVLPPLR